MSIPCNNPGCECDPCTCGPNCHCGKLWYEQKNKRIPRKKGQPAGSDKHSDLYTDENPKGTIHGLKFATVDDAKASVAKIKKSGRPSAHSGGLRIHSSMYSCASSTSSSLTQHAILSCTVKTTLYLFAICNICSPIMQRAIA